MAANGIFAKHVNPDVYYASGVTIEEPTFTITVQTTQTKQEHTVVKVVDGEVNVVNGDGSFSAFTLPEINNYVAADSLPDDSAVGKWVIKYDDTDISFKLSATAGVEQSIITWRNQIIAKQKAIESPKRTVFMDSNIALTDGTAPIGSDAKVKTIPNLYQAISNMSTRIDDISVTHGASTADAGLFVKQYAAVQDPYQGFLRAPQEKPCIEIVAGDKLTGTATDGNATIASTYAPFNHNMHFKANEITFTVSNPNETVSGAYEIAFDSVTSEAFHMEDTQNAGLILRNAFISAQEICTDNSKIDIKNDYGIINNMITDETNSAIYNNYFDYLTAAFSDYKDVDTNLEVCDFLSSIYASTPALPSTWNGDDWESTSLIITANTEPATTAVFIDLLSSVHIGFLADPEYMNEATRISEKLSVISGDHLNRDWLDITSGVLLSHYWVPMEDYTGSDWIDTTSNSIKAGGHGKLFTHIDEPEGYVSKLYPHMADPIDPLCLYAKTANGVINKNGTVVHANHAVTNTNVTYTAEKPDLKVSGEMTYNLGAIIEAIQELNRRTMFMDIDMTFNGAMSYGDYNKADVDAGKYTKVLDGLPAASDSNLEQHGDAVFN